MEILCEQSLNTYLKRMYLCTILHIKRITPFIKMAYFCTDGMGDQLEVLWAVVEQRDCSFDYNQAPMGTWCGDPAHHLRGDCYLSVIILVGVCIGSKEVIWRHSDGSCFFRL